MNRYLFNEIYIYNLLHIINIIVYSLYFGEIKFLVDASVHFEHEPLI